MFFTNKGFIPLLFIIVMFYQLIICLEIRLAKSRIDLFKAEQSLSNHGLLFFFFDLCVILGLMAPIIVPAL